MGFSLLEMNFKDTVGFSNVIFHLLLQFKQIVLINFLFNYFKHVVFYIVKFACFRPTDS